MDMTSYNETLLINNEIVGGHQDANNFVVIFNQPVEIKPYSQVCLYDFVNVLPAGIDGYSYILQIPEFSCVSQSGLLTSSTNLNYIGNMNNGAFGKNATLNWINLNNPSTLTVQKINVKITNYDGSIAPANTLGDFMGITLKLRTDPHYMKMLLFKNQQEQLKELRLTKNEDVKAEQLSVNNSNVV